MYTIQKSVEVSCAHRLEGHFKCSRMHGHNYVISVTVEGSTLDEHGMLIDFGDLKDILAKVSDAIDHKYIVSNENVEAGCPYLRVARDDDFTHLPITTSTAENLAVWVATFIAAYLPRYARVHKVTIRETSSSVATYVPYTPEDY